MTVKQGAIRGVQERLPNGGPMYCFKGIPYAHPPIGRLRFQSPVPLEVFKEAVLDASNERDVSYQKDVYTGSIIGSENCLFLNVYTPVSKERRSSSRLSVMIWFHGGAFLSGSGNSNL